MLQDELRALGLHRTEVTVYLFLLDHGVSTPAQIAKATGILRTNCYYVLQNLEAQGLIRTQKAGARKAYLASDPEALFKSIDTKREIASRILSDLRGLYVAQKNKPKIQFYEGFQQIKEAYWRSLEAKEIYAFGSTHTLSSVLPNLYKEYVQEVRKRKIVFKDILSFPSKSSAGPAMKQIVGGLYDMRYLPEKYGDLQTDLLIWDDCVAQITLEEPAFATIITSRPLNRTMRTIFNILYDGLR